MHTVRRLWKRTGLDAKEKQDLNRRFAAGFKVMSEQGELPPDMKSLLADVKSYQAELDDLGIPDYQVPALYSSGDADTGDGVSYMKRKVVRSASMSLESEDAEDIIEDLRVPYRILHLAFTILIAAAPTILLNLPVGVLSSVYAEKKRKKALANSKVKIHGRDVLLSEQVMFCIVMVPMLWLTYLVLLVCFTSLTREAVTLVFWGMPISAYAGIMMTESGMVDFKDLRPTLMKLRPSTRARLRAMPARRRRLVEDLKAVVGKYGPGLGGMYYDKEVDWAKVGKTPPGSPKAKGREGKKED